MPTQPKHAATSEPTHLVVLCHPAPESFNAAIAQTYCDAVRKHRHHAEIRDLYRLKFDPVLKAEEQPSSQLFVPSSDIVNELDALQKADVVVLVYPIWFGTPPAMMKGYVDRILGAGFGHRSMRDRSGGSVAANKHLLSITTSGNSIQWLEGEGAWLSLQKVFDSYLTNAFSMASSAHLHLSSIVDNMSERYVREELFRVSEIATATCAKLLDLKHEPVAAAQ